MTLNKTLMAMLVSAFALGLSGCSDDDDDTSQNDTFSMQLLHFADMDGDPGAIDRVDNFSGLVNAFRDGHENTLVVSSGDNVIPGPRYFAASANSLGGELGVPGNGRADMAFLNAMGVSASVIGNHDLDSGPEEFASTISAETGEDDGDFAGQQYEGANFPFLATNLDVTTEPALAGLAVDGGQSVGDIEGRIAPSAVVTVGGERIGLVGATTPALASITSTGGIQVSPEVVADTEQLYDDLAAEIQPTVDALADDGINKIVLLAHMQQIAIEKALAERLNNVDIIVAGGSNTLLADADDVLISGDEAADDYPLSFQSPDGEPVLVVNVDGDYKYLGRLQVTFDEQGRIQTDKLDPAINGVWASTDAIVDQVMGDASERVASVSRAIREVLQARDGNIVGQTTVYLDGRRGQVRTEETNLGNLTADANLWYATQFDRNAVISLKNGGGIRSAIGQIVQPAGSNDPGDAQLEPTAANPGVGKEQGDVSQFDIEGSLRFNNSVALLTVTGAELRDILEHAVAATEEGATPGQFPQVGGLRFSFDPTQAARSTTDTNQGMASTGQRIRSLVVTGGGRNVTVVEGGTVVNAQAGAEFRLATLGFLAGCVPTAAGGDASDDCGDGYPFKNLTTNLRTELTDLEASNDPGQSDFSSTGGEQDAFAEYLLDRFNPGGSVTFDSEETAPARDERIQNLSAREDTVIAP